MRNRFEGVAISSIPFSEFEIPAFEFTPNTSDYFGFHAGGQIARTF